MAEVKKLKVPKTKAILNKIPKTKKPRRRKKKTQPKKQPLVLIKLGGSVITDKQKARTLSSHMRRLAKEIKEANLKRLVIVHGGGSFGHHTAKKHGTQKGLDRRKSVSQQIQGFVETQNAMEELDNYVIEELLAAGIPAFPLQLSSFVLMEDGKIKQFPTRNIRKALNLGMVPVVYGVPALDLKKTFCILSGDEILNFLAKKLRAKRVLLASDVDGVMTADPKLEDAKLIKTVTEKNITKLKLPVSKVDVTGGMFRKVHELLSLARLGIQSEIINATVPGNLRRALKGEKIGTIVK